MKRAAIIQGLMTKDISQLFRNKFFAYMTVLGIVLYAIIYYVMPKTIDETFEIALYAPEQYKNILQQVSEEEGIEIKSFESVKKLKEGVEEGDFNTGIVLPEDFEKALLTGEKPKVKIYYPPDASKDIRRGVELILKESAFALTGQRLPVGFDVEVLGKDRAGEQIPPRDRLRPTLIVMILFMEIWGIANLITEETGNKTLEAILVTPAKVSDVIAAKGAVGTLLAFSEAALLAFLLGALKGNIAVILATLLLGALMVTGISFVIAAFSKDMLIATGYSVLGLLLLIIPAIAVIFPGSASLWVRIFPSYYLVEVLDRMVTYGESWVGFWRNLVILLAFDIAVFPVGVLLLRRRFR